MQANPNTIASRTVFIEVSPIEVRELYLNSTTDRYGILQVADRDFTAYP